MKSAYLTLGVPGNATAEDIEAAFQAARRLYGKERMAEDPQALENFQAVKIAYDVLRDPSSRAAHDRKLAGPTQGAQRPQRVVVIEEERSPMMRMLIWGAALVAFIFALGFYVSHRNAEAVRVRAELELAAKEQAEREANARREEAERVERERELAKARAEAEERRFAAESQMAFNRANADRMRQDAWQQQMQRQTAAEAERKEAAQRYQEQRTANEARMRVEADRRRIRELCYLNYRRYDC